VSPGDAGGLAHAANVLLTDRISVVSMTRRRATRSTPVELYIGKVGMDVWSTSHPHRKASHEAAVDDGQTVSSLHVRPVSSVIGHSL
jgi:hypothetical protein